VSDRARFLDGSGNNQSVREDVLRDHIHGTGPVSVADLTASTGLSETAARAALVSLFEAGELVRARQLSGQPTGWLWATPESVDADGLRSWERADEEAPTAVWHGGDA